MVNFLCKVTQLISFRLKEHVLTFCAIAKAAKVADNNATDIGLASKTATDIGLASKTATDIA